MFLEIIDFGIISSSFLNQIKVFTMRCFYYYNTSMQSESRTYLFQ